MSLGLTKNKRKTFQKSCLTVPVCLEGYVCTYSILKWIKKQIFYVTIALIVMVHWKFIQLDLKKNYIYVYIWNKIKWGQ